MLVPLSPPLTVALAIAAVLTLSGCPGRGMYALPPDPEVPEGVAMYEQRPWDQAEGRFDQLAIAPDGRQVAFVGNEADGTYELFVAEIGGSIRTVSRMSQAIWSPRWSQDGSAILITSTEADSGATEVHVVDAKSGRRTQVASLSEQWALYPTPSFDVAITWNAKDGTAAGHAEPVRVDLKQGGWHALPAPIPDVRSVGEGAWSLNGDRLAILVQPDDGPWEGWMLHQPEGNFERFQLPYEDNMVLHWTPDGRALRTYGVSGSVLTVSEVSPGKAPKLLGTFAPLPDPGPSTLAPLAYVSPSGDRVVLGVRTILPTPDGASDTFPPQDHHAMLIDMHDRSMKNVADHLWPVGWLDDEQLLCLVGEEPQQRLKVVKI